MPEEILVYSSRFGYFRKGDKIILQGEIIKEYLKHWDSHDYLIRAAHHRNETLQIGD